MKVAVTGASGFVGRYLVQQLLQDGHQCRCWRRATSDVQSLPDDIEWVTGQLNSPEATRDLLEGCDAVIHAALDRPGDGFRGAEGDLIKFVERNLLGSLRLMEEARRQQIERFETFGTGNNCRLIWWKSQRRALGVEHARISNHRDDGSQH